MHRAFVEELTVRLLLVRLAVAMFQNLKELFPNLIRLGNISSQVFRGGGGRRRRVAAAVKQELRPIINESVRNVYMCSTLAHAVEP